MSLHRESKIALIFGLLFFLGFCCLSGGGMAYVYTESSASSSGLPMIAGEYVFRAGFQPDPFRTNGWAGGPKDGSDFDASCFGSFPETPNHTFRVEAPLQLWVRASGTEDLLMAIEGPNGWTCVDDAVGLDPQVSRVFQPGSYRVYVGTYGSTGVQHELLVSGVREPGPSPNDSFQFFNF